MRERLDSDEVQMPVSLVLWMRRCQLSLRHALPRSRSRRHITAVGGDWDCARTLLFKLLVNSLAAAIRRAAPGVRRVPHSDFRFTCQLHDDDLVILAESESDLPRSPIGHGSGASRLALVLRHRQQWCLDPLVQSRRAQRLFVATFC